jgi:sulfate adenylyltransferase subunit 1
MPWYDGPTVLGYLETVDATPLTTFAELRFPVQQVVRPQTAELAPWASRTPDLTADYRGYAGQIASGRVRVGDEVVVLPRGSHTTVVGIDTPDGALDLAVAGQSVILRLAADIDVSRGDLIASTDAPPAPVREVAATVSWLADRELEVGARVLVQHGTSLTKGLIRSIEAKLDLGGDGEHPVWVDGDRLALNDLARIRIAFASPLPIDAYNEYRGTGAFILVDAADGWTLGAGMAGPPAFTVEHRRTPDDFDVDDVAGVDTPDTAGQTP